MSRPHRPHAASNHRQKSVPRLQLSRWNNNAPLPVPQHKDHGKTERDYQSILQKGSQGQGYSISDGYYAKDIPDKMWKCRDPWTGYRGARGRQGHKTAETDQDTPHDMRLLSKRIDGDPGGIRGSHPRATDEHSLETSLGHSDWPIVERTKWDTLSVSEQVQHHRWQGPHGKTGMVCRTQTWGFSIPRPRLGGDKSHPDCRNEAKSQTTVDH